MTIHSYFPRPLLLVGLFTTLWWSAQSQTFQVLTRETTVAKNITIQKVSVTTDKGKYALMTPQGYRMTYRTNQKRLLFNNPESRAQMALQWHSFTEDEQQRIAALRKSLGTSTPASGGPSQASADSRPNMNKLKIKPEEKPENQGNQALEIKVVEAYYRQQIGEHYRGATILNQFVVHADRFPGPGFLVRRTQPLDELLQLAYIPLKEEILIASLFTPPADMAQVENDLKALLMTFITADPGGKLNVEDIPGEI